MLEEDDGVLHSGARLAGELQQQANEDHWSLGETSAALPCRCWAPSGPGKFQADGPCRIFGAWS